MNTLVRDARLLCTMDDRRTRIPGGWVYIEGDTIARVGAGEPPPDLPVQRTIDARGKLVLPGLVNTHHHLPQTLTRNVPQVQEAPLFRWLVELYEIWRGIDADAVDAAARVGLGELLLTGCTTTTDHLYLFPQGQERLIDVEIAAARELGIRFQPTRGSMSRGHSKGGLPPDDVVQDEQTILEDCRRLIREHHDPRPRAMTRIALAPCSPFSVTDDLMRRTLDLAREHGVRLHTHMAETKDEEAYCQQIYGCRPVEYLRRLGWLYALVAGVAALTTTPMTQPNSMALVLKTQFGVAPLASGLVIAVLAALVIIGGIRSIGRAAERLSPLKVGLYLAGGLWVLVTHAGALPEAFAMIFRAALSPSAALGGAAGWGVMVALRYGLARGIYANEAGYGTAAVVYGSARSDEPRQQGLNAVMEVFIVSFVTSSISALTILVTGVWRGGLTSTAAVAEAFNHSLPTVGGWVVAFCVFLFGYTTLIGWCYYGEQFLEFVAGPRVVLPYRVAYCALIVVGATSKVDVVWNWGDLMNGLQIFPNLVGVLGLSGLAAAALRREPRP